MALRNLQRQADERALEAARLKAQRNAHAARILAILRAKIATPGALALCFGAGLMVGQRSSPQRGARRRPDHDGDEPESGVARVFKGPLGSAAFRVASAYLVGAATGPGRAP